MRAITICRYWIRLSKMTHSITSLYNQLMVQRRLGIFHILFYFAFYVLIISCSGKPDTRPILDVPPEKVEITRFDQLLCSTDNNSDANTIDQLLTKYPVFTDVFFNQVIFPTNTTSIKLENLIQDYCSSPAIQHLTDTTRVLYPSLQNLEEDLGLAFGYFHYHFPDRPIPRVFTYVSEFGVGTFTVDTRVLGIGLDFFLGEDYPFYDPAVFPRYMQQTMTSEYISANAVRALAQVLLPPVSSGNLLDYMIHNGKILYLASRFLPQKPMHQLLLYTPEQMEWTENNELNIWSYLIDLGYFYETDQRKFRKFIEPSPNTPGMPQEAPGRLANWIGYRIVEAYMNRNPEVSLPELAADTDFQSIMDKSKYKPVRPG